MSQILPIIWTTGCLTLAMIGAACVLVGAWPLLDKVLSRFKKEK